ncbi:type II secretion system protein GspM [Marinomonas ostreistagni]|uniref:Type II secretion system protein M n=1 Tax=Marinomonas ostreistagni TaxID=359209 RepID=A0ABS0ZAZ1_9GAMM|nr:type II secretion system protein GspM [Marinomonas ostreistagni]MBJ7550825.1 type II secretion system protein M [Marinomonas ostreistagni]
MKTWFKRQYRDSTSLKRMLTQYRSRTMRERILLKIAAVMFFSIAAYLLILKPLEQQKLEAQRRLDTAQRQYQLLQMNAQKLVEGRILSLFKDRNASELRRVLGQTATEIQFSADRVQVEGDSHLQVWASDVAFVVVSKWLNRLAEQQVGINNLQLERVDEGRVNLRITLD